MKGRLRRALRDTAYGLLRAGVHPPTAACATFVEIARLRQCLKELRIDCVLDVGANAGQFAARLRRLGYEGWIYSFEPNRQAYETLAEVRAKDHRWRGYPIALGSTNETRQFHLHQHSSLSSFLRPLGQSELTTTTNVEVRRLDTFQDDLMIASKHPRILLKMDTQGWDVEVVKGAGSVLARVEAMLSELSVQALYEGMTPYYRALEFFEQHGFVPYEIAAINHAADGSVVECDCLMIRRRSDRPNS